MFFVHSNSSFAVVSKSYSSLFMITISFSSLLKRKTLGLIYLLNIAIKKIAKKVMVTHSKIGMLSEFDDSKGGDVTEKLN